MHLSHNSIRQSHIFQRFNLCPFSKTINTINSRHHHLNSMSTCFSWWKHSANQIITRGGQAQRGLERERSQYQRQVVSVEIHHYQHVLIHGKAMMKLDNDCSPTYSEPVHKCIHFQCNQHCFNCNTCIGLYTCSAYKDYIYTWTLLSSCFLYNSIPQ